MVISFLKVNVKLKLRYLASIAGIAEVSANRVRDPCHDAQVVGSILDFHSAGFIYFLLS